MPVALLVRYFSAMEHGLKKGDDGLTARERAFALERRKDCIAPNYVIAKRAGYKGTKQHLEGRARAVSKMPAVMALIHAPARPEKPLDERELADELRRFFLTIVRNQHVSAADKIRAADRLGATLQGFYVPVQVNLKGQMTMEAVVRAMGGAPEETDPAALPEHREDA